MRYGYVQGIREPISRCVLGTSAIRDGSAHRILDAFFEAGGSCIDTARFYGGGRCEVEVGTWIRRAKPDRLCILAKGAHPPNCRPSAVASDLSQTLDALGVETVDLYLLHRDDPSIPVDEFVDALDAEVAAGRVRACGASNWQRGRLEQANSYAALRGRAGMVAWSNHLSLAEPVEPLYEGCEAVSCQDRRYLETANVALFPWSSQARGFFASVPPESLDPNVWRCWGMPDNYARRDRARRLAADLGVRPINVALAFVLNQPFPTFPIIGPRSTEELSIALEGVDLTLDSDQLRWLELGDVRAA